MPGQHPFWSLPGAAGQLQHRSLLADPCRSALASPGATPGAVSAKCPQTFLKTVGDIIISTLCGPSCSQTSQHSEHVSSINNVSSTVTARACIQDTRAHSEHAFKAPDQGESNNDVSRFATLQLGHCSRIDTTTPGIRLSHRDRGTEPRRPRPRCSCGPLRPWIACSGHCIPRSPGLAALAGTN